MFLYITYFFIKGIVYPKKWTSFTHPHVDPNLYDFLSSVEHGGGGGYILKNVGDQTVPVGSLKKYNGTGYEEEE